MQASLRLVPANSTIPQNNTGALQADIFLHHNKNRFQSTESDEAAMEQSLKNDLLIFWMYLHGVHNGGGLHNILNNRYIPRQADLAFFLQIQSVDS